VVHSSASQQRGTVHQVRVAHQLEGSSCDVRQLIGAVGGVTLGLINGMLGQPCAGLECDSSLQRTLLQVAGNTQQSSR